MTDLTVVNMWCGPRTVSTALMYAWRQRSDTLVFDEPFYGLYLRDHDPGHPGRDEVLAARPGDLPQIIEAIRRPARQRVRFVKNIGHHLDALPITILDEFPNALLVRDPARVIASLDATLHRAVPIAITGLPQQSVILDHERAAGRTPVVVDADRLLADPGRVLTALCAAFGLDLEERMLSWPAGPKPEDGPWAPHWYGSVHRSTRFGPPPSVPVVLDEAQQELLTRCRPLYDRLLEHHIAH
jgi:hypothetical protein